MRQLTTTWWFKIPFAYWLAGILIYPPVFDRPPESGYVRSRMWVWDFVGDDWNATALFDTGTALYQLCVVFCLAWILRAMGSPIVRLIRPSRSEDPVTKRPDRESSPAE
ncbi:MAG: hypothetical protein CMJ34_00250 [Phycisphaerae bacterium]|nr:hypothetical protein [Phycisphaerae bacterium]